MCLTLYIGSDVPFVFDPVAGAGRRMALVPADGAPRELADRRHVAMIVEVAEGKAGCSCAFQERSMSWEEAEETTETRAAFDRLRRAIVELMAQGGRPVVFACWTDMEDDPPALRWRVAPAHLRPGSGLFTGGELMPGGMPADTYRLDIDAEVSEPAHRIDHV